jgi:hypothetical protein
MQIGLVADDWLHSSSLFVLKLATWVRSHNGVPVGYIVIFNDMTCGAV